MHEDRSDSHSGGHCPREAAVKDGGPAVSRAREPEPLEGFLDRGPARSERTGEYIASHSERPEADTLEEAGIWSKFRAVNKELYIILAILAIAGMMSYLVTAKRMVVGFYTIPTVFSAYFYGRRHAVLTAFASVFLVGLLAYINPAVFGEAGGAHWETYDVIVWGGILILTAYAMGSLHDREKSRIEELRQTYYGLLMILKQLVCKDTLMENHAYRVSCYACKIAEYRGLGPERIEDVRAASLLHEIGNLETCRQILSKATQITQAEHGSRKGKARAGPVRRDPIRGRMHRIIPMILAHRRSYDARLLDAAAGMDVSLEARIIKVADAFDMLTSDRPNRKVVMPLEAKNIISRESGSEFDPTVVHAFKRAFRNGDLQPPGAPRP